MTTRWGIAGTGKMAEVFLRDFEHVPDAEAVAVGSRTAERAAEFAAQHGIDHGMTYGDLVGADVDVLYIATPHPQHHDLALAAIAAGVPVLVEKSFTATLAGAHRVVDAARQAEVFCMEAMWTRVQPAVVRAQELVASGELGEPLMVQADLGMFREFDPVDRLFDPALGGGAILDLGVYVVSIAQHFLGTPDRVTATGTLFPNGTDATAAMHLAYDDGRAASVQCSLASATPGRAVLAGTGGSVELSTPFHHPTELVVRRNGQAQERIDLPATGRGYARQIAHVGECLAAGLTESPVVPLQDTLDVQWVMEEALTQLGVTYVEGVVPGLSA
jgi:predicted dehydrogenase